MYKDAISTEGLKILKSDLIKTKKKYQDKIAKIEAKNYIVVKGENIYDSTELRDMYEADMITLDQMDRYEEKLNTEMAIKRKPYIEAISYIDIYLDDVNEEMKENERN